MSVAFGQPSVALRTIVSAGLENEECARRRKETLAKEGTQEEWKMENEEFNMTCLDAFKDSLEASKELLEAFKGYKDLDDVVS